MTAIIHKSVLLIILYLMVIHAVKVKEDSQLELLTKDFCEISELEDLNYYLFCDTKIHKEESDFEDKPAIIFSGTSSIDEAKELYRNFEDPLPLNLDEKEKIYVEYVSPDCRWIIATQWDGNRGLMETARKQQLFYEKKKVKETVSSGMELNNSSFMIVQNGDFYQEMDEEQYRKFVQLNNESYRDGYYDGLVPNEEGTLAAGVVYNKRELTIRSIKENINLWNYSFQGMDDPADMIEIVRFTGNEEAGKVIIQCGLSDFYEISYPTGDIEYLGQHMYAACFSPDRKYVAYSSVDHESRWDMELEEYNSVAPGIYIREIETGKTAFFYWDPFESGEGNYLVDRSFMWIEKEGFEEYMDKDCFYFEQPPSQ